MVSRFLLALALIGCAQEAEPITAEPLPRSEPPTVDAAIIPMAPDASAEAAPHACGGSYLLWLTEDIGGIGCPGNHTMVIGRTPGIDGPTVTFPNAVGACVYAIR